MCIASKQIKLCTCSVKSYERLQHYWLLSRFNENKDLMIIGEAIFPAFNPDFAIDSQSLLLRLNETDIFDQKIDFIEDDRLDIVLNNLSSSQETIIFCFKFQNGKWVEDGYCPFELMNHYDEVVFGKIKMKKLS